MEDNQASSPIILIIEDDIGMQEMHKWSFSDAIPSAQILQAYDRDSAFSLLNEYSPNVIILDLGLPPDEANATEGIHILQAVRENSARFFHTQVLVYSGSTRIEHALEATKYGAHFVSKGAENESLISFVKALLQTSTLRIQLSKKESEKNNNSSLIGNSKVLRQAFSLIEKVADTEISVFLHGESGTGKEVFASQLHQLSGRQGNFVAINCASIPADLLENELFGHEKGAFTGATTLKKGKVEQADNGTLFLDEIGDMPFTLQSKILRFLQEGVIQRVGGGQPVSVNVRVVCATHRNIPKMIKDSEFRQDLYYRLNQLTVSLPPLRERGDDILLLARFFLSEMTQKYPKWSHISGFSESAEQAMLEHEWTGNVRELSNKIQSAIIMSSGDLITAEDLGLKVSPHFFIDSILKERVNDFPSADQVETLEAYLAKKEHQYIDHVISVFGSKTIAANHLGISRATIYNRISHTAKILSE